MVMCKNWNETFSQFHWKIRSWNPSGHIACLNPSEVNFQWKIVWTCYRLDTMSALFFKILLSVYISWFMTFLIKNVGISLLKLRFKNNKKRRAASRKKRSHLVSCEQSNQKIATSSTYTDSNSSFNASSNSHHFLHLFTTVKKRKEKKDRNICFNLAIKSYLAVNFNSKKDTKQ